MKRLGLWDNFLYMQKIYRKWWFWLGLAVLIIGVWYVWGYASWWLAGADSRAENRSAYLGWLKMEADSKTLEAQYRADKYGGATPKETLRLFIEALEKKDYELAAKYFVVEERSSFLSAIRDSDRNGFLDEYIGVLNYRHAISVSEDKTGADIDFFDSQNKQAHFGQMTINPFTDKWKISKL